MPKNNDGESIEVRSRVYLGQGFIFKYNSNPPGGMLLGMKIEDNRGTVKKITKGGSEAQVDLDSYLLPVPVPIVDLHLVKS